MASFIEDLYRLLLIDPSILIEIIGADRLLQIVKEIVNYLLLKLIHGYEGVVITASI